MVGKISNEVLLEKITNLHDTLKEFKKENHEAHIEVFKRLNRGDLTYATRSFVWKVFGIVITLVTLLAGWNILS